MKNSEHRKRFNQNLHVHRKNPGSEYSPEGCEWLCRPCHQQRHRDLDKTTERPPPRRTDLISLRLQTIRDVDALAKARGQDRDVLFDYLIRLGLNYHETYEHGI